MIFKKKESSRISTPLRLIIEELKDGFCTIDTQGEFLYINKAAKEMFEITHLSEEFNFFKDIVKNKSRQENLYKQLDEFDYVKDFETDLFSVNNKNIPVLLTMNNIINPDGEVIAISCLIKDMTEIKKVQMQLLQAQKMESLGLLASGIAHEFNNILTGIIPNAELIRMTTKDSEPNFSRAQSIHKSALRAADIVKELLSFARNERNRSDKYTDFYKNATETVEILQKLFSKKIKITADFPKNAYHIKIDETRLQQILMNLAINAKDALNNNGNIVLKAKNYNARSTNKHGLDPGLYLKFVISDNGHGIKKEFVDKIFDPFFTTKEPGKGTGLGLSIVYNIIKNIKGKLEVKSEIGKGTTFTIFFPAENISEQESKETVNITQQTDKDITVLIIDDEPLIREMASDMLSTMGYKVKVASNGMEGIKVFSEDKSEIDLILLDLMMPGMSGASCLKNLKSLDDQVKVVITSGISDIHQKEKLRELGASGYLEKPFSLKKMSDTIQQVTNA